MGDPASGSTDADNHVASLAQGKQSSKRQSAQSDNERTGKASVRSVNSSRVLSLSFAHAPGNRRVTTPIGTSQPLLPQPTLANHDTILDSLDDQHSHAAHRMLHRDHDDAISTASVSDSLSGLSNLDNATDTFERRMASAVRDQQRLQRATLGPAQPFGKRRRGISLRSAMDDVLNAQGAPTPISATGDVINDRRTTQAPLVTATTRDWGSRARHNTNYLKSLKDEYMEARGPTTSKDMAESDQERRGKPRTRGLSQRLRAPSKAISVEEVLQIEGQEAELAGQDSPTSLRPPRRRVFDSRERNLDLRRNETSMSSIVAEASRQTRAPSQNRTNDAGAPTENKARPAKRDPRLLLRQLARAASATPSPPAKPRALTDEGPADRPPRDGAIGSAGSSKTVDGLTASNAGFPNGEYLESDQREAPREKGTSRSRPQGASEADERLPQTPKVTGGWVDTPNPARATAGQIPATDTLIGRAGDLQESGGKVLRESATDPDTSVRGTSIDTKPDASKLAEVQANLEKVKKGDSDTDAAAEHLRREITAEGDGADGSSVFNEEGDTPNMVEKTGAPASRAEKERQKEIDALNGMAQRLHATRSGLRVVKKDMKRVESRLSSEPQQDHSKKQSDSTKVSKAAVTEPQQSSLQELRVSTLLRNEFMAFKSILYVRSPHDRRRLTWFGISLVVILLWLIGEVTLCNIYCHPRYARTMVGYGVDIDAPEAPFVMLTIILRSLRWLWGPPLRLIAWLAMTVIRPLNELLFNILRDDDAVPTAVISTIVSGSPTIERVVDGYTTMPGHERF